MDNFLAELIGPHLVWLLDDGALFIIRSVKKAALLCCVNWYIDIDFHNCYRST
jgi:hypothetical protein